MAAVTIPGWGDQLILVFILASGTASLPTDPHVHTVDPPPLPHTPPRFS